MSENQLKLLLAARELHMSLLNDRIMALQKALDDALLANEALEAALIEKNAELAEYKDLCGTHEVKGHAFERGPDMNSDLCKTCGRPWLDDVHEQSRKSLDSLFPGDSQRLVALMIKGKFQ